MITVKYSDRHFEMPENCLFCPCLKREDGGGFTIDTCSLLKDPDWTKNAVKTQNLSGRDPKCPLKDGTTVYL